MTQGTTINSSLTDPGSKKVTTIAVKPVVICIQILDCKTLEPIKGIGFQDLRINDVYFIRNSLAQTPLFKLLPDADIQGDLAKVYLILGGRTDDEGIIRFPINFNDFTSKETKIEFKFERTAVLAETYANDKENCALRNPFSSDNFQFTVLWDDSINQSPNFDTAIEDTSTSKSWGWHVNKFSTASKDALKEANAKHFVDLKKGNIPTDSSLPLHFKTVETFKISVPPAKTHPALLSDSSAKKDDWTKWFDKNFNKFQSIGFNPKSNFAESKHFVVFGFPCCYGVTKEQLQTIFPDAADDHINAIQNAFNEAYDKFHVDTCARKAHFFAQVMQEVGANATINAENLNYTPQRLIDIFGYFQHHPAEAQLYGRVAAIPATPGHPAVPGHPADQPAIANRAYANRGGNGDIASGDGWRFRGKGFLQLTFRDNYTAIQNEINLKFPTSGIDIITREGDILTVRGAVFTAMAFWSRNNLHSLADHVATNRAAEDTVVNSITNIINPATDSKAARRNNFQSTKVVFELDSCPRKPS